MKWSSLSNSEFWNSELCGLTFNTYSEMVTLSNN